MKKKLCLVIIMIPFIIFSEEKKAQGKLDSSGLVRIEQDNKKTLETRKAPPANNKEKLKVDMLVEEDPSKLEKQVKALQLILKNEKDRNKKINLYLRLSYLHVSIAKKYGIERVSGEKINSQEKKHLDEAIKVINFLLKNIENNKRSLSTLYNIKGLVSFELDDLKETIANFIKSIELNPKNTQAEVMSIFIGEYYFDEEKYDDAIKYYQLFYNRMSKTQKALSDYKVAWSYLNKKDSEKAEMQFIKVIVEDLDKGTTEDAYKDLAFILTQNNEESQLINKVNSFTKSTVVKGHLYYYCLLFYLQNSKDKSRDGLFKEVLSIEKDPYKQLKILVLKVSFEKKDIPTKGMVVALDNVAKKLKILDIESRSKFFKFDANQLEDDSEFNIRVHIDAYTGRLKAEESVSKLELGNEAIKHIQRHIEWFPLSKKKNILYNLWIDTCVDLKNSTCLFELESLFKTGVKNIPSIEYLKKVQIELLALYDAAFEKDKIKHQQAFVKRLKSFAEQFPSDPISLKSQKRLFGIYIDSKNYAEALPYAENIFKVERNAESVQKILICLYEMQRYEMVLNDPVYNQFSSIEITDIKREASLKSAMINANKGNFEKYENDIQAYLKTKPIEEKAMVVYVDYFKKLIELNLFQKFINEWKKLTPQMQSRKSFTTIKSLYFDKVLSEGDFVPSSLFWMYGEDKDLNAKIVINKIAFNTQLTSTDLVFFNNLNEEKKNYLLALMNYSNPMEALSILKLNKNLSEEQKKIYLVSLLLKSGTINVKFEQNEISAIRKIVPEKYLKDTELKIEENIKNVIFPNAKMKPKTYESYVVNNVDNIKFLRARVLKALKTATHVQKMRIFDKMSKVELGMAQSIKDSPPPQGLNDAQLVEYKSGLVEMAKEYEKQGQEFAAAKLEIENILKKQSEDDLAAVLPEVSLEDWNVSHGETREKLNKIISKTSVKAAMMYLDNLLYSKKMELEEYYNYKTWVILKMNPSEALRKYYFEELMAANQTAQISKWRSLKK